MEKTKEFDKAWKKTCPTCIDNPSNILYYKKQCSACEDKDAKAKKYTEQDIISIVNKSRETGLYPEYLILSLNKQD
jgi:hypothetical protein